MRWIQEKPIILMPLLLLLAFLIFPLMHEEKKPKVKQASVVPEKFPSTSFPDYDLLPENLKQRMEEMVKKDTMHSYSFYYFFEVDDVNRHFYITDAQHEILNAMPVTNPEVFELVDEKIAQDKGKGHAVSIEEKFFRQQKTAHKGIVSYVLPEDKAQIDFNKLQVGILKMHLPYYLSDLHDLAQDTHTYKLSEVDQPPVPIRGLVYFKKVVMDEIKNKASFIYDDLKGEVVVEFTIGHKAISPQFVKDFADSTYEAYRAGGIILRAINDSKVHWKSGIKNGKHVNTRVGMSFYFEFNEEGNLELSMSDLYPATKTF